MTTRDEGITVAPHNALLTTQQAADLLVVSRPTLVKLIDDGVLPSETSGVRRRLVKLTDVLSYRAQRREQQYQALMADEVDYDEELPDDLQAEQMLRSVRAEVAATRRNTRLDP
ncbi:helix-turn-helix domain-containing protein [Ornithinimicrobium faecis]|uniref:Helix-turn-helix domain-containing protein n=1 Tax=Ornithinimicrobium faecis TaxID=2934158 RepID=A0ABY4YQV6_9MICO|nr:helix-turn-helix domain-containing protein [Ornithinimicrobium sp. HY1793]USQ79149.1 helix-turn-helix domain-containing protein [Ornithinimicrobium sp. HY1793]